MTNPTDKRVMRVAEQMAEVLARDYEELVNFVFSSLEAQYKDSPESFLEDWREYVEEDSDGS